MIETGVLMLIALIATVIIVWAWQGVMHQRWVDKHPPTPIRSLSESLIALGKAAEKASEAFRHYGDILAKIEERHDA